MNDSTSTNEPAGVWQRRPDPRPPDRPVRASREVEHLFRRAGFGLSAIEASRIEDLSYGEVRDRIVDGPTTPVDVDRSIGQAGYAGVRVVSGVFAPNTRIADARQRWLFRMVHGDDPLREKMAIFWHNHFATGYGKVSAAYGSTDAARMMAARPSEDPGGMRGQVEMLRELGLGSFRELLVQVAEDPAMLVWLDGRLNTRTRPQENFGREILELFTLGVGFYTEADVRAAARAFTGWSVMRVGARDDPANRYVFVYNASQHDASSKTFSFPVYADGSTTIPARSSSEGHQDGLDLIDALVRHPETGRRLARRLWAFFVSDLRPPDSAFVDDVAGEFQRSGHDIRATVRRVLESPAFDDESARFARYSWPVEYVARLVREVGWAGFSLYDALSPLANMGQVLYEPPDVAGWRGGADWISSGTMLARANFAATLLKTERAALAAEARGAADSPGHLVFWALSRLPAVRFGGPELGELASYLAASGAWPASEAQLQARVPGLLHLIAGSAQYQFV